MVLGLPDPQLEVILPEPDVGGQGVGGVVPELICVVAESSVPVEKLRGVYLTILGVMLGYSSLGWRFSPKAVIIALSCTELN